MKKTVLLLALTALASSLWAQKPIEKPDPDNFADDESARITTGYVQAMDSLAMRVTEGTSAGRIKFIEIAHPQDSDIFIVSCTPDSSVVTIAGNSATSMAVGLNWYLKYVAGIHLSWNQLTAPLPDVLPMPKQAIRKTTDLKDRYYLNYCTFSYSMPFWNADRWEKEIDWMALHGVNMPLMITGTETLWRNVLRRLGYTEKEIGEFICGPAYFAWWLMNNLEGWGGPLPDSWYQRQEALAKQIIARMHSLGIEPVLPGYSGMVPHNIGEKLGYDIADPGLWCGFRRPAFQSPADPHFDSMADLYYEESAKLFGPAKYYSMDPFHEGGNTKGVDLNAAGHKILAAMKRVSPEATWVVQSWGGNPMHAMIDSLPAGSMKVLDLYSDKNPKWQTPGIYADHDWLFCMLLNFGGNVGLHGYFDNMVTGFYDALADSTQHLTGVGSAPEGIENNPMMFELIFELPWRAERINQHEWLYNFLSARYGMAIDGDVKEAWNALYNTVYNPPQNYPGQGTVESLFCARPEWNPRSVSTWGMSELFYSPDSTAKAAALMEKAAPRYAGNANFAYDLIDIKRQANADQGNRLIRLMEEQRADGGSRDSLVALSEEFLSLILKQDSLLQSEPSLDVDTWLDAASGLAGNADERKQYRANAARLITVWGDSVAANHGGLHEYSHREWAGMLKDLYYNRWKAFFDAELHGAPKPDFYRMEEEWVAKKENE